ncbi:MAG: hypothetical protein DCC75_11845 [Proteobacteria bacterium]|nr:MAG: hypothetical protein DCC75_11845 [Pseudomonadota bacterium]
MDIVAYSTRSVEEQMQMKSVLNESISLSLAAVRDQDRVILDTGDGAAICFLADPEHAIVSALSIRKSVGASNQKINPKTILRSGLHLGPVRLVKDLNGLINAVGDGINVGQRIMSFAGHEELVASRPFVEVTECLREEYQNLFVDRGVKLDKHKREHHIFLVQTPQAAAGQGGSGSLDNLLPAQAWESLEKSLGLHVGPIAKVLVKRSKTASSMPDLIAALSAEIEDAAERQRFIQEGGKILTQYAPAPSSSALKGGAGPAVAEIDDRKRIEAEKVLASYVGPVARLLVKRALASSRNLTQFYNELATHIPNSEEQREFLLQFSSALK